MQSQWHTDSSDVGPDLMTDAPPPTSKNAGEPAAEGLSDAKWAAALQAAKLEALAEFAAGAGHEINNPLAIMSGRVQMLLKGETDPERRHALLTIGGQIHRIRDMIGDLMLFGRPPRPSPQALDLTAVVCTVLGKLAEAAELRGCRFETACEERVPIWADRVQLSVTLSALVQNAIEASPEGGVIRVEGRAEGPEWAVFSVSDRGRGLGEAEREHLFDPFFSGRQAGRGLGFGLSKCWRIVLNHGGRMDVSSTPGGETRFSVNWPARPNA